MGLQWKKSLRAWNWAITGIDRWKNGEVVGKKGQFFIQIWRNEGIQFLAC